MSASVCTPDDADWASAVDRLEGDVYHLDAYHRVAEANGEGRAQAFIAERGGDLLFHPFLRRPILRVGTEELGRELWDLESAYGYVGPIASIGAAPTFLAWAWDAFRDWCVSERVVAEFVRFNPLLANERFAARDMHVVRDRETVALRLTDDEDALWREYPSTQRNMVRKAQQAGLEARVISASEGLEEFRALYVETMNRINADARYAFGHAYFTALVEQLGDSVRVVVVSGSESVAAACLLLARGRRLHYHLAGSRTWARSLGASNLMLHAAALWGSSQGMSVLHLGGGRSGADDDSLFRFKASIGRSHLTFHTGRRVYDEDTYAALRESWLRQTATEAPQHFLLYRLPL
jgi:hypothetical protein